MGCLGWVDCITRIYTVRAVAVSYTCFDHCEVATFFCTWCAVCASPADGSAGVEGCEEGVDVDCCHGRLGHGRLSGATGRCGGGGRRERREWGTHVYSAQSKTP